VKPRTIKSFSKNEVEGENQNADQRLYKIRNTQCNYTTFSSTQLKHNFGLSQ